jgi:hypothetical protein
MAYTTGVAYIKKLRPILIILATSLYSIPIYVIQPERGSKKMKAKGNGKGSMKSPRHTPLKNQ